MTWNVIKTRQKLLERIPPQIGDEVPEEERHTETRFQCQHNHFVRIIGRGSTRTLQTDGRAYPYLSVECRAGLWFANQCFDNCGKGATVIDGTNVDIRKRAS